MLNEFNEWRHLREILSDDIIIVDAQGTIGYVSESVASLAGYEPTELLGRSIEELVPDDQRDTHVGHRERYLEAPTPRSMSGHAHRMKHRDGRDLSVAIALSPLVVDGRTLIVAAVALADVAASRDTSGRATKMAAAARLAEQESHYRLAFERTMAPMYFTDRDNVITTANDAYARLVGRAAADVVGHRADEFTHPADLVVTRGAHADLLAGDLDEVRFTKRYVDPSGRITDVESAKSVVRSSDGLVQRFIVSELEITERVQRDRFLTMLAAVHRLAILATNETQLLEQFCQALVDVGGYALACFTSATSGPGVVAARDPRAAVAPPKDGPINEAISRSETRVYDVGTGSDEWRRYASEHHLRSGLAIPLRHEGVVGAITVLLDQPDAFFPAHRIGLEELVHELELGLAHIAAITQTAATLASARTAYDALAATEAALAESERRFRLAFSENMAPMVFVGLDDRVIDVNDAFLQMVGRTRDELVGRDTSWITHPEDVSLGAQSRERIERGEVEQFHFTERLVHQTGRIVVTDVLKSPVRADDGRILYFIVSERDVTEERHLADQLLHRALHDPLTGLANRALFEDRLGQARERLTRNGGYGAVLLIDLDDFKGVNDTYGHPTGDRLLVGVARRFELVTRSSDTLCRVGGDEFLYLAENLSGPDEVTVIAERLLNVLVEPFSLDGLTLEQNATIGVAICHDGVLDGAECIKYADTAMYEAKRHRRGHFEVFTPDMLTNAINRFTLAQSLSHALRSNEVTLYYQPIVSLPNFQVVGFEALLRWDSSREGSIPPSVFIPIAEQSDLILGLGDFALREAVRVASTWGMDGSYGDQCYVSVNLSAVQFRNPDFVSLVREVLEDAHFPASRLVLEISESIAMSDLDQTISVVERLRDIGVEVALDGFGTGHSSLPRLVELRPKMVKIDRSFVHALDDPVNHDVILDAVFTLGHDLGVTMLAEGIETVSQLTRLRGLGCQLVQGFLLAPPVPQDEVLGQLATRPKERAQRVAQRAAT